jgi:hypothetical protein
MKLLHPTLGLVLALASACRAERDAAAPPPPPDPMVALPGDADVEAALETLDVRTSGSELEFGLKNKTDAPLEFCWSVEWYDPSGARVAGSALAWHPAKLDSGAVAACRVPMPTPDASSWRLRAVRPGSIHLTQGVPR